MAPPFLWIPICLFVLLITIIHVGSLHGARSMKEEEPKTGVVSTSGLLFSLLSLILAFTLYDANSRLSERRQLIAREAAAIRVLNLRLSSLPARERSAPLATLHRYAQSRAEYARTGLGSRRLQAEYTETRAIQAELWASIERVRGRGTTLDTRIDQALLATDSLLRIAAERHAAAFSHVPALIYLFIGFVSCGSAYMAGRSLRGGFREQFGSRFMFCAVIAMTMYAICDLDHPREGLIRLDRIDQAFTEFVPNLSGDSPPSSR